MAEDGAAPSYVLVIGNKNTSSWSLRPWLALRKFKIPFDEINIALDRGDTRDAIRAHSPAGLVPILKHGPLVIWDSLAILEYLAEAHPDRGFWPRDAAPRATARAVAAEMHSGFYSLCSELPMDFLGRTPVAHVGERVARNIARIVEVWRGCRADFGASGPYLFGDFTIADAMYAPVASRFRTYGIDLGGHGDDGTATAYADAILALPEVAAWADDARRELADGSHAAG
ncbi:MAG: glutathione S-transferase family protein [Methyloligellaceae bacterium]